MVMTRAGLLLFAYSLAFLAEVLGFLYWYRRRGARRRNGLCVECGYNLTGNISGACPECGAAVTEKSD